MGVLINAKIPRMSVIGNSQKKINYTKREGISLHMILPLLRIKIFLPSHLNPTAVKCNLRSLDK
jgi:hypothetical protein